MIHDNGSIIEFLGIEILGLYWTYVFGFGLCTRLAKHVYSIAYQLLMEFINLSSTLSGFLISPATMMLN